MEKQKTKQEKALFGKENLERKESKDKVSCADKQCPIHGNLKARGRSFRGYIIRKFPRRICR